MQLLDNISDRQNNAFGDAENGRLLHFHISPYAYCAWNPVRLVDPEGREIVLIGTAEDMQKAIIMMSAKLGIKSNLSFSVDEKGRVVCSGEAKTDTGQIGDRSFLPKMSRTTF